MDTVATNVGGFITTTVTTECSCTECVNPECDETYTRTDETCQTCNADTEATSYCFGCWGDMNDELAYLLAQWEEDGAQSYVIMGTGMGWRHRSGWKVVDSADAETLIDALSVNGEWTQTWTLEDGRLTARQSHHDSMGETYEVLPLTLDSFVAAGMDLADLIDMRVDEIVYEAAMSRHCHSDAGPFDARDAFDVMQHMGAESVDEVFDVARRVARAEWADERLRSIRYADLLPELRY